MASVWQAYQVGRSRKLLGELLIDAGLIDSQQLSSALAEQKKWGGRLGKVLVELGLCTEGSLVRVLGAQLNLPVIDLEGTQPDGSALKLLPGDFCMEHQIFPFNFSEVGRFLDIAMVDPTDVGIHEQIRVRTNTTIRPYLAGPTAIERAVRVHYRYLTPAPPADPHGSGTLGAVLPGTPAPIPEDLPPLAHAGSEDDAQLGRTRRPGELPKPSAAALTPTPGSQQLQELIGRVERNEQVMRKILKILVEKGVIGVSDLKNRLKLG